MIYDTIPGLDIWERGRYDNHDVIVADLATGRTRDVTCGVHDHTGFTRFTWSPTGRYLAMLSTRGGAGLYVYVWDAEDNKLARLS